MHFHITTFLIDTMLGFFQGHSAPALNKSLINMLAKIKLHSRVNAFDMKAAFGLILSTVLRPRNIEVNGKWKAIGWRCISYQGILLLLWGVWFLNHRIVIQFFSTNQSIFKYFTSGLFPWIQRWERWQMFAVYWFTFKTPQIMKQSSHVQQDQINIQAWVLRCDLWNMSARQWPFHTTLIPASSPCYLTALPLLNLSQ